MNRGLKALITVGIVLVPSIALACPVCGQAPERSRAAYLFMTYVMSLLPLVVMGAMVAMLVRRLKRAEREADRAREIGAQAAEPNLVVGAPHGPPS